ncbi:MAG: DNA polymerase III subunit alpha, partial [Gemmataceae bacterium]
MPAGVQLHVHSAYSFLEGASLPEELVRAAAARDIGTLALTDGHRLSGVVTFLKSADAAGLKAIVGATVTLPEQGQLVLLVPDTERLIQLTRILTHAHLDHPRGSPRVEWEVLEQWGKGLVALSGGRRGVMDRLIYAGRRQAALETAQRLQHIFGSDFYLEIGAGWLPGDRSIRSALRDLGQHLGLSLVASSEVRHAERQDFPIYDLMVAIRNGLRIEEPHPDRPLNTELYLKDRDSMRRALGDLAAEAMKTADRLAERLQTPDLLGRSRVPRLYQNPETAWQHLQRLVWEGARRRYREHWKSVRPRIGHELGIIRDLGFVDYFLVVEDVTRFARQARIRFAGRGSAADSAVAYCLGITEVDAVARALLFERFLSRERAETPDIDIDFDARRRDEVAQYVIARYGRERVAAVATYQTFRARLAIRQIGRVLGFPPRDLDVLAKSLPPLSLEEMAQRFDDIPELRVLGLSPASRRVLEWAAKVEGRPRHIGTHLGGLVISGDPLELVTPLERSAKGVEICQFDKRDVETLGLMKLDLLSLRTFTAVDMAVQAIAETDPAFRYEDIPREDPAVYRRLQEAESIGVFQLESPAQRALARRLQPDR